MLQMDLLPYAITWAGLCVILVLLAIWRAQLAGGEDDALKLSDGEVQAVSKQLAMGAKLNAIGNWIKYLTWVLVVTGLILGGIWGLQLWDASSTAGMH